MQNGGALANTQFSLTIRAEGAGVKATGSEGSSPSQREEGSVD